MLDRVVVDVVEYLIIVVLITNSAVGKLVPYPSLACHSIRKIPFSRCRSVQSFENYRYIVKRLDTYQDVVVVWQDDPASDFCINGMKGIN